MGMCAEVSLNFPAGEDVYYNKDNQYYWSTFPDDYKFVFQRAPAFLYAAQCYKHGASVGFETRCHG